MSSATLPSMSSPDIATSEERRTRRRARVHWKAFADKSKSYDDRYETAKDLVVILRNQDDLLESIAGDWLAAAEAYIISFELTESVEIETSARAWTDSLSPTSSGPPSPNVGASHPAGVGSGVALGGANCHQDEHSPVESINAQVLDKNKSKRRSRKGKSNPPRNPYLRVHQAGDQGPDSLAKNGTVNNIEPTPNSKPDHGAISSFVTRSGYNANDDAFIRASRAVDPPLAFKHIGKHIGSSDKAACSRHHYLKDLDAKAAEAAKVIAVQQEAERVQSANETALHFVNTHLVEDRDHRRENLTVVLHGRGLH